MNGLGYIISGLTINDNDAFDNLSHFLFGTFPYETSLLYISNKLYKANSLNQYTYLVHTITDALPYTVTVSNNEFD